MTGLGFLLRLIHRSVGRGSRGRTGSPAGRLDLALMRSLLQIQLPAPPRTQEEAVGASLTAKVAGCALRDVIATSCRGFTPQLASVRASSARLSQIRLDVGDRLRQPADESVHVARDVCM